jgi:hypothetical protein
MLDTFGEHGSAMIAPDRELRALFAPDAETRGEVECVGRSALCGGRGPARRAAHSPGMRTDEEVRPEGSSVCAGRALCAGLEGKKCDFIPSRSKNQTRYAIAAKHAIQHRRCIHLTAGLLLIPLQISSCAQRV